VFLSLLRVPPLSPLFPYTTLFRSYARGGGFGAGGFGAGPSRGGGAQGFDFSGFDFSDRGGAGGRGGGGFRDIFSSIFGGGRGGGSAVETAPERGSDLEYQVNVSFWDAIRGTVMRLNISRLDTCSNCHGTGSVGAPATC